jgi:hypothetical protein
MKTQKQNPFWQMRISPEHRRMLAELAGAPREQANVVRSLIEREYQERLTAKRRESGVLRSKDL